MWGPRLGWDDRASRGTGQPAGLSSKDRWALVSTNWERIREKTANTAPPR